jgi:hypothetical protein
VGIYVVTQLQAALVVLVAFGLIVAGAAWLCVQAGLIVAGVLLGAGAVLLYDAEAGSKP